MQGDLQKIRYLGDVRRLTLNPGDIVVINAHKPLSVQSALEIKGFVEAVIPNHRVLVLEHGLEISVLSSETQ